MAKAFDRADRDRREARWAWAAWLPALGTSAAVLLVPAPPFVDYAWHLAAAEIYSDFDRVPMYRHEYVLRGLWGPNVAYHALAAASGRPTLATPALLALAICATTAVALALGRRYRAGPIYALTCGLFTVHYSTGLGFLEFTLGVPIALLVVLILTFEPRGDRRRPRAIAVWSIAIASAMLATFVAHAMLCCLTLGVVGTFALMRWRASRLAAVASALAAMPAAAALLAWKRGRQGDPSGVTYLRQYYRVWYAADFRERILEWLTADHHFLISTTGGRWTSAAVFALATGATLTLVVRGRAAASAPRDDRLPPMAASSAFALVAFAIAAFAPPELPPVWALYQRFIFAMVIGVALWAGARAPRAATPRVLLAALTAANVALCGLFFEHVWSFGAESRALVTLATGPIRTAGWGASVVGDPAYRGEPLARIHAANLMTAFGHRPVMSGMFDYAGVRVAPAAGRVPPRYGLYDCCFVDVESLLPHFDEFGWALVHDSAPPAGREALARLAPVVARAGPWTLYARPAEPVTGTAP